MSDPRKAGALPAEVEAAIAEYREAQRHATGPVRVNARRALDLAITTAIAAARREPQWQPIETAPKDGTAILINSFGWAADGSCGHDDATTARWAGWTWRTGDEDGDEWPFPTHWMPLPPLPSPPAGGSDG